MDKTETHGPALPTSDGLEAAPLPEARGAAPSGSQSKLSPVLFLVLVAALIFRVVTGVLEKEGGDTGAGLVRWVPHGQASAAAALSKRPILYDFTAAWCAPCHQLDREGWGDSQIAGTVNSSFLPVRIVDRSREDGKNLGAVDELQRRYSINAFPTLIVADASGRQIAKLEGYPGRERLARFLKESGPKPPR